MSSPAYRLKRTAIPPALVAEYEAAKEEHKRAVERLSEAKAAVTAALDQEAGRRRVAKLAAEAVALKALLDGSSTRRVCELVGLKPSSNAVSSMQERFRNALLSDDELYGEMRRENTEDYDSWARRMTILALERYQEHLAGMECP